MTRAEPKTQVPEGSRIYALCPKASILVVFEGNKCNKSYQKRHEKLCQKRVSFLFAEFTFVVLRLWAISIYWFQILWVCPCLCWTTVLGVVTEEGGPPPSRTWLRTTSPIQGRGQGCPSSYSAAWHNKFNSQIKYVHYSMASSIPAVAVVFNSNSILFYWLFTIKEQC